MLVSQYNGPDPVILELAQGGCSYSSRSPIAAPPLSASQMLCRAPGSSEMDFNGFGELKARGRKITKTGAVLPQGKKCKNYRIPTDSSLINKIGRVGSMILLTLLVTLF